MAVKPHNLGERLRDIPLPSGFFFFEMNGEIVYPLYGHSGGICAQYVCYLMEKGVGRPTWDGKELGTPGQGILDYGGGWRTRCIALSPFEESMSTWLEPGMMKIIEDVNDACHEFRPFDIYKRPSELKAWVKWMPRIFRRKVLAFLTA